MKINFNQKVMDTEDSVWWITSDLHFWHKSILKFCPDTRPFSDVETMNEALIEEWNSKVRPNDYILHLGDFCFKAKEATQIIMNQLNGNIIWIRGNHDHKVFDQMKLESHHYLELWFESTKLCMSHYPMSCWNRQGYGSVMLHGHTHSSYDGEGRTVDVGYDKWDKIMRLRDIVDFCLERDVYCPDHHKIVEK